MNKSPTPKAKKAVTEIDFYKALKEIMTGKSVTRKEWGSRKTYCFLRDGRLSLHKPDGKDYDWIISDGDIYGDDWIVL